MTDSEPVPADETDEPTPEGAPGGAADSDETDEHLENLPDGAGCTEIWEHLSKRREADADD